MKYMIEIEDVPFSKVRIDDNGAQNINLYRAKGFNSLVFDKNGLDKLTPLNEELPSAQPQRTGYWINKYLHKGNIRECSVCHVTQSVTVYDGKVMFKFCPYCGMKVLQSEQRNCSTCRHDSASIYCRGCEDYKLWQPKGNNNCDTCKHQNDTNGVNCRNCFDQLYQWEPKEGDVE